VFLFLALKACSGIMIILHFMNMEGTFFFKGLKIYNEYGILNESVQYIRVKICSYFYDRFRCYKYSEEQV
jgi:hypothetical protein